MAWTPYAIVTFYAAFLGKITMPLVGTIPALFAKSSFVWSSLLFIYSSVHTKKVIRSMFSSKTRETIDEVSDSYNATIRQRKGTTALPRSKSALSNPSSQ